MQGRIVSRFLPALILAIATALLWLSYDFASTHRVFGTTMIPTALHVAASIAVAILFVMIVGQALVRHGVERMQRAEATSLQRRLVVAVLSFVAAATVLAHFGFDFRSVLVFSALITGVVGLALQPLLGSMLSGLALDRAIRVGDGFLLNGDAIEVTSLNWRSVVGRKSDGTTIVLPNTRFADNTMEILRRERPVRAEARFEVSLAVAPHRLQALASEIVANLAEADPALPVVVAPLNLDRGLPFQTMTMAGSEPLAGRYRILFGVRQYAQRSSAEGRVLRRLWYALRRENLVAPANPSAGRLVTSTIAALRPQDGRRAPDADAEAIVAAGEPLLYDDGERIALPERMAGRLGLLIEGSLAEPLTAQRTGRSSSGLSREAALARIGNLLTERIGPYAEYALGRAAAGGASLMAVCQTVAQEIDDPAERARFLEAAAPPPERIHDAGLVFRTRQGPGHRGLPEPPLWAVGHALILALPEAALAAVPHCGEPT